MKYCCGMKFAVYTLDERVDHQNSTTDLDEPENSGYPSPYHIHRFRNAGDAVKLAIAVIDMLF
jgi:hypothetical protein